MDTKIEKLRVQGNIYIWEYTHNKRNYPSWNLMADRGACESLVNLLELMHASPYSSHKTIQTSAPTEKKVRVANRSSGFKTKQRLTLNYKKDTSMGWQLDDTRDELVLTFDDEYIDKLKTALLMVKKGEGDFTIADEQDEHVLNFWWNLE